MTWIRRRTLAVAVLLASPCASAGPIPNQLGDTGQVCTAGADPMSALTGGTDFRLVQDVTGSQAVSWDRLRMPPRLTPDRYHPRDLFCQRSCATCPWTPRFPGRRVGLVALKTHLCDFERKACLRLTRELADRCNRFIRDNFAVYQTRNYRNTIDRVHVMDEDPNADRYVADYGNSGPTAILFDIRDCNHIHRLGSLEDGTQLGLSFPLDHPPPASERHASLERAILGVAGVSRVLKGARPAPGEPPLPEAGCLGPGPSLDETWQALENQEQAAH